MKFPSLLVLTLLVISCSPALPPETMSGVDAGVSLSDAARKGGAPGKTLLAGGVVLEVGQRDDATWIEILDWNLDERNEPAEENPSGLRYYVVADSPQVPNGNLTGRLITLAGTALAPVTVERFGRHFSYPVLQLVDMRIWPRPVDYHPARLGLSHSPPWQQKPNARNPYDSGNTPYPWASGQLRP